MCPLSSDYIYIGNYRELCRLPAAAPAEESARRHSYQSVSNSSSSSVWFTMFTKPAQTHEYARHTTAAA